jgi:ABC-type glutathione transport system ATPase component
MKTDQLEAQNDLVLELTNVSKEFKLGGMFKRSKHVAVDNASLSVKRNQVVGLVGESGSGKSTLGRISIGLIKPTSGSVRVLGQDIFALGNEELRLYRRKMQMIFQDSSNSLNPRMSLQELIEEPMRVQNLYSAEERRIRARALADEVQLAEGWLGRYAHEFSGGQRQRISIARGLALEPELIVADEPVSALDVSVQARVLNLLKDIQESRNLSMIFVSHDMAVVEFMSDQVAVLYNGKIMENGSAEDVFANPKSAYTRTLLDSSPSL